MLQKMKNLVVEEEGQLNGVWVDYWFDCCCCMVLLLWHLCKKLNAFFKINSSRNNRII